MPRFKVNAGLDDEREIEAKSYRQVNAFVMFSGDFGEQLFAIPVKHIETIELVSDDNPSSRS